VWRRLIEHPPENVDVLLLEGTRLSRSDEEPNTAEADVERQIADLCATTDGIALACYGVVPAEPMILVTARFRPHPDRRQPAHWSPGPRPPTLTSG